MGVDARMYFTTKEKFSVDEFKKRRYIFGSAFKQELMIGFEDKLWYHPLEIIDRKDTEEYSDWPREDGAITIKVPLTGRYYGPGYERGPIFTYISIAEFLERQFPRCTVYYGGDSDDVLEIFDKENREEMYNHYLTVAKEPYVRGFSSNKNSPICPHCDVQMIQHGVGGNYASYTCQGCGWNVTTKDGQTTIGFRG